MIGKSVYLLAFLVSVIVAANAVPQNPRKAHNPRHSHDMTVGYRRPGDRLVLNQRVFRKSTWNQVVTVQQTFNVSRHETITQIIVVDETKNGNGATARVLYGGPGMNNVTLHFKSQTGHGIHMFVKIYAEP